MSAQSAKQWYYAQARQKFGPVTAQTLAQLYEQGNLHDDDLVWSPQAGDQWKKAGDVRDLFLKAPPPPPESHAAYSNPVDPLPSRSTDYGRGTPRMAVADTFHYAGFFARLGACIIDYLILGVVNGVVITVIAKAFGAPQSGSAEDALALFAFGLTAVIAWLYFALQECGSNSATIGKRALGLVVTDLNGDVISFGRATARYFGKFLSSMFCLIGYFLVFFTPRKQALHDILASCIVMK